MVFGRLFNFFEIKSPTQGYELTLKKQLPSELYERVLSLRNGMISKGGDQTMIEDSRFIKQLTAECAEYLPDQDTQFSAFISGGELVLAAQGVEELVESMNIDTLEALTILYNDSENSSPAAMIDQYRDDKFDIETLKSRLSEAGYELGDNFSELVDEMYKEINASYAIAAE